MARSSTCDACRCITCCPRTHSTRARSIPAVCPNTGSKLSNVSISATTSPRWVAAASNAQITLARPEERGPITSERCPRGSPPPSSSSRRSRPVCASRSTGMGRAEAMVPSSFRVRRSDSSRARFAFIRFFFAYYSADHPTEQRHAERLKMRAISSWPNR